MPGYGSGDKAKETEVQRAISIGLLAFAVAVPAAASRPADAGVQQALKLNLGSLPLAFEPNEGQADPSVKFIARGPGYKLFLLKDEAALLIGGPGANGASARQGPKGALVKFSFDGASPKRVGGVRPFDFRTNYFFGPAKEDVITGIPNFAAVKYDSLYQGIDLVYYGKGHQLEYDFIVAPHARAADIRMRIAGANAVSLSNGGELRIDTAAGEMIHSRPLAYQEIDGKRHMVDVRYRLSGDRSVVAFDVGAYDHQRALVIDPLVVYSTMLWGAPKDIAVDASGNAYVAGTIFDATLPTAPGYQTRYAGAAAGYVVKLDHTGANVIYATYFGVRDQTIYGDGISVDEAGNAYLFGRTNSASLPVTAGAYQTTLKGAGYNSYIAKFNPSGTALVYSTYVGDVNILALASDASGNAYLTGESGLMTGTAGAYQPIGSYSAFAAKLNPTGSSMLYATFIGETSRGKDIAVDQAGNAYVTGTTYSASFETLNPFQPSLAGSGDAFIVKLNPAGSAIEYSSYLGGSGSDEGLGLAVTPTGEAVIVGKTTSENFPVSAGAFQRTKGYPGYVVSNGFVTRLDASGSLVYASYLGGTWCSGCSAYEDEDAATTVAVDAAGHAYVGGYAGSIAFPAVDAIAPAPMIYKSSQWYAPFIAKINPMGTRLLYSMPLGERAQNGNRAAVAVDPSGNAYIYGSTILAQTAGVHPSGITNFLLKFAPPRHAVILTSSANPSLTGREVTFTAQVEAPNPGGSVTFMSGEIVLGTAEVIGGTASITTTLSAGVYPIAASYSGNGATAITLYQRVNAN